MSGLRAIRQRLEKDRTYSLDVLPQELPGSGVGDYREDMVRLYHADGSCAADFRFESYEVQEGAYRIPGLPAAYDTGEEKGETLVITMRETASAVKVKLYYGVFEKENVITRTVCIENQGKEAVILDKALSCNVDFLFGNWDLIYFEGRHAMERIPEQRAGCGMQRWRSEVFAARPVISTIRQ